MVSQRRSTAEVNFSRLARRMEEMVRDREAASWRFARYLQALRGRLGDLKRLEGPLRPDAGRLKYYEERVAMLQSVLAAEQKATVQEKADLLGAVLAPSVGGGGSAAAAAAASAAAASAGDGNIVDAGGSDSGGGGVDAADESTARDVLFSREVLTLSKAHLQEQTRRELLSFGRDDAGEARRRPRHQQQPQQPGDHQALQDSVTENMLHLARALKQSAKVSGDTVRSDLSKIRQLSDLQDTNYGRLKTESGRLDQQLSQPCNWLLWFMVALVAVTFVGMVMFMRLFSKKIRPAT